MLRRLSVIFAILANSVLWVNNPVLANPEACVNKVVQRKDLSRYGFDTATQVSEVEHDGIDYHWINLFYSDRKSEGSGIASVFATNRQGLCKLIFIDISGPLSSIEDYQKVLGKEVTEKFMQSFRDQ